LESIKRDAGCQLLSWLKGLLEEKADEFDSIMLWEASRMCNLIFFEVWRSDSSICEELRSVAHLSEGDVRLNNSHSPSVVQVDNNLFKTDPSRRGVMVYLGEIDKELCPVVAVSAHLAVRGRGVE